MNYTPFEKSGVISPQDYYFAVEQLEKVNELELMFFIFVSFRIF